MTTAEQPTTVEAIQQEAAGPSESDDLRVLRAELARTEPAQSGGLIALLLLAVFVFQGLSEGSVRSLLIIVGVLLVHEGGHALGMKAFGYRDVRVFFLPYFGAVTTGRKEDAPAWQQVIVSLLGPLPGLIVGLVLHSFTRGAGLGGEIAITAIYVNAFNLLPFEPLDGGRVVGIALFSRSRWLEAAFSALGALALLGVAVSIQAWILAVVSLFMLPAIPHNLRLADAALRLRQQGVLPASRPEALPTSSLAALDEAAQRLSPAQYAKLPTRVALVRSLHGKMRVAPPGPLATLLILGAYFAGWLICFVAMVVIALLSRPADKAPPAHDGGNGGRLGLGVDAVGLLRRVG